MRQSVLCHLLLSISFICIATEPDSFSQEAQERKKYLDPGIGVQDHFSNKSFTQEFCEFILSQAPVEVIEKIKLMTSPFCPAELRPKRIILVGPSGSGKTTLAQIMGLMSLRPVVYINAGMLGNEFKNSAVQNLRRAIEPYINSSCVVILDEIDYLLKQSQHDRNLDADLPKQIWEMFDICADFPGITLIGVTNDISGMPEPLRTRLAGDITEVPMVDGIERRKAILEFYLNQISQPCDPDALDSIVQKTKALSHRELVKIIQEAYAGAFLRDQMLPKIKIDDLEKALQKVLKNRKLLNKINWKDYEKHFQYGTQTTSLVISIIGVAAATYMASLSLKVSKDALALGERGLDHSMKHGNASLIQNNKHFKKNYKLSKAIADKNDRRYAAGLLLQNMYAVMSRFVQHDGFTREVAIERAFLTSDRYIETETSKAAYTVWEDGREILRSLKNGTFEELVDKAIKNGKIKV